MILLSSHYMCRLIIDYDLNYNEIFQDHDLLKYLNSPDHKNYIIADFVFEYLKI